jgi:hypothetical protein
MPRNSRYAFPPGVASMTQAEFTEHRRRIDEARRADKAAQTARRAEVTRVGPSATLATLAVGASHTFPQYKTTGQLSSALRGAYVRTGKRYSSKVARDLLTGETVIGVTVTRTM